MEAERRAEPGAVGHGPGSRLATYGTLAPGCPNHHHHQLGGLAGRWREGQVRGTLAEAGRGVAVGYPGLTLDPAGAEVTVQVFESQALPDHWSRLDDFEGLGYQRVVATIRTSEGDVDAWIYVLAPM